jgi:hypothetical protein
MLRRTWSSLTLANLEAHAMGNSRVIGICIMIFGALVAIDGAVTTPFRWWGIGAGLLFILVGLRFFLRSRAAVPPVT